MSLEEMAALLVLFNVRSGRYHRGDRGMLTTT